MGAAESTPGPDGRAPPSWMSGGSRLALRFLSLSCADPRPCSSHSLVCFACTGSCCTNYKTNGTTGNKPDKPFGMSQRLEHANVTRVPVATV
jgi:hypothetical protein